MLRHFALVATLLLVTSCTTPLAATNNTPNAGPNDPAVTSVVITMKGNEYTPAAVTLKKGGSITWKNMDAVVHDAKPNDGKFTNPGDVAPGTTSKAVTFTEEGVQNFGCSYHPSMKGKVTVVP